MVMIAKSACSVDGESHRCLLFLEGDVDYEEIELDDETENFIDDILEAAQWYTILNIIHLTSTLLTATFQPGSTTQELPNNYYPFIVQKGYIIDMVSMMYPL
jgi:hypothetical protein